MTLSNFAVLSSSVPPYLCFLFLSLFRSLIYIPHQPPSPGPPPQQRDAELESRLRGATARGSRRVAAADPVQTLDSRGQLVVVPTAVQPELLEPMPGTAAAAAGMRSPESVRQADASREASPQQQQQMLNRSVMSNGTGAVVVEDAAQQQIREVENALQREIEEMKVHFFSCFFPISLYFSCGLCFLLSFVTQLKMLRFQERFVTERFTRSPVAQQLLFKSHCGLRRGHRQRRRRTAQAGRH